MTEPEKKSRVESLEETVLQLIDKVEDLEKQVKSVEKTAVKKSTGLFGGKRKKTAIKDNTTGTIYPSKASVGKALYGEVEGGDPADHFMWYKLQLKFPERFVEMAEDSTEAQKIWADEKAKQEAAVAEANRKLAEEEKAKKKS